MIRRNYPHQIIEKYKYPKESILIFDGLKKDKEFLKRFELFTRKIDFRTGKKIEYCSREWRDLVNHFRIRCDESDEYIYKNVYFQNARHINYEDYLKECDEIDKRNILMINRNDKIPKVIEEIDGLKYWNDYVLFEEDKYGIPKRINNIHRENDCFGDVIYIEYCDTFVCRKCLECIH